MTLAQIATLSDARVFVESSSSPSMVKVEASLGTLELKLKSDTVATLQVCVET